MAAPWWGGSAPVATPIMPGSRLPWATCPGKLQTKRKASRSSFSASATRRAYNLLPCLTQSWNECAAKRLISFLRKGEVAGQTGRQLLPCCRRQGKMCALWVLACGDPASAGNLHRLHQYLASAVPDSGKGSINGFHGKIELPVGYGDLCWHVHHSAGQFVSHRKQRIDPASFQLDLAVFPPAELMRIEGHRRFPVARIKLTPADVPDRSAGNRRLVSAFGVKQHEHCALRIGDDREAAHAGNVGGLMVYRTARLLYRPGCSIRVCRGDVACPCWRHACCLGAIRQVHDAGNTAFAG